MNTQSLFLSALLVAGFASPALALDGYMDQYYAPPVIASQPSDDRDLTKRYPDEHRDSGKWETYVGRDVENNAGDVFGKVTDLALDMKNGRILAVIITKEKATPEAPTIQIAVPPNAFTELKSGGVHGDLILDISPEKFAAAQRLNPSRWDAYFAPGNMASVYHYYHVQPYFTANPDLALGTVKASSSVKGLAVWNTNTRVGHVTAVRVDHKTNRLMYVVASENSAISSKCDVFASHAKLNADQTALSLDVPQSGAKMKPLSLR